MKLGNRNWLVLLVLIFLVMSLQIGCSKKSSPTGTVKRDLVKTLLNESREAGYDSVMWDQKDDQGSAVIPGVYYVHMVAGSFDTSAQFEIEDTASGAPPSEFGTSSRGQFVFGRLTGTPPHSFSMYLTAEMYSTGDTVGVYYALPVQIIVRIDIER
jgi:hypothetical protein